MSYIEHFKFAFTHGVSCIFAGFLLIAHSIIPAVFEKAGSSLVNTLNKSFVEHNELLSSLQKKTEDRG